MKIHPTPELLPYWMEGLTPEMAKRAETELGETPEVKRNALSQLRHLIDEEQGFRPLLEETFLLRFLRARKFDVQKAFRTLKNYYANEVRYSGCITHIAAITLKPVLDLNTIMVLPKRDRNGCGTIVCRVAAVDGLSPDQHMAAGKMIAEIAMEAEATQVCGGRLIFDFSSSSFSRFSRYATPYYVGCLARFLNDSYPIRNAGVHIVNGPSFINFTLSCFKLALTKKIRDRVHIHYGNLDDLYEFIPRENLPESLGGLLGHKAYKESMQNIMDRSDIIEKINKYTFPDKARLSRKRSSSFQAESSRNVLNVKEVVTK